MADQTDRHEESVETDETRYERAREEEIRQRHEAAERLDEPQPASDD